MDKFPPLDSLPRALRRQIIKKMRKMFAELGAKPYFDEATGQVVYRMDDIVKALGIAPEEIHKSLQENGMPPATMADTDNLHPLS